jgi:hypothetical protein
MNNIKHIAAEYAKERHNTIGQKYNGQSYFDAHILKVVGVAEEFKHLLPEHEHDIVIAACFLHDAMEDDHSTTYNDMVKKFGAIIAEIVYAVSNEKGRNRAERANEKYYEGIRTTGNADFVKMCDRIANVRASEMKSMYRKEHQHFKDQLYSGRLREMWDALEKEIVVH